MRWTPRFPFPSIGSRLLLTIVLAGCAKPANDEPASHAPSEVPPSTEQTDRRADAVDGGESDRPAAALAGFAPPVSAADAADGWIALFDGHSEFGWESTSDANWSVVDGTLRASEGEPGFLMSHVPFADFELRCEYRLEKGGNSGLFLRSTREPQNPATDCYEFNLCDTHPEFPTGSLVGRRKTDVEVDGEGEWKRVSLRVEGRRIVGRIDDETVIDFEDDTEAFRAQGFIGLQFREGIIEFRKVELKPLGMRPIFDGESLSGWREVPGSKSEFTVDDGTIRATNGPGFLETEGTWGDFVFQGQARTNADGLNSGLFFRAMPGTEEAPSNGYEFQIHNVYRDGDPTQPADQGTGAIFRRAAARRVVAKDREWLTMTLVAAGPRFATWVNGYPVVAWTDDRAANENPRRGLRVEPGHLSLQGHDPTTDVQFRSLRVAPLPE